MGMKRSKLKRRLRKKFHVGEFQELCFEIQVFLKLNLSESEFNIFTDDFILEAIEKNRLEFGGGGDPIKWSGFASSAKKYHSPNIEQRDAVGKWLENRKEVEKFEIGDFRDAWHNWD